MTLKTDAEAPVGETPVQNLINAISDCLPAIGGDAFTERFLSVARLVGAAQVTAFSYEPHKVNCLLSRNFLSEVRGGALAAAYLDGGYREDPLFGRALALEENACIVVPLEEVLAGISQRYLTTFFSAPGFGTKVAVLVAQGPLKLVLNLYFEEGDAHHEGAMRGVFDGALWRLIGRTLATHFQRLQLPEFPLPLTVLSERERQVCVGMLAGKKAEIIAEEMGVGPSSVVTYRQRAYQKLGISSRGELFSICRP